MSNATGDMRAVLNACVSALDDLVAEASAPVEAAPGGEPCDGAAADDAAIAALNTSAEQGAIAVGATSC